jgi:hypothetical protein
MGVSSPRPLLLSSPSSPCPSRRPSPSRRVLHQPWPATPQVLFWSFLGCRPWSVCKGLQTAQIRLLSASTSVFSANWVLVDGKRSAFDIHRVRRQNLALRLQAHVDIPPTQYIEDHDSHSLRKHILRSQWKPHLHWRPCSRQLHCSVIVATKDSVQIVSTSKTYQ